MKKSLIGTLALGLIIGAGALTAKSFANETNLQSNQNVSQSSEAFTVLNNETNQFEKLDDSEYKNSKPSNRGCCAF